jgi:hypothetical protein
MAWLYLLIPFRISSIDSIVAISSFIALAFNYTAAGRQIFFLI